MSSPEAGFLHAITADRSDDTARLVYADWLDEADEPERASYLRLQVELVRTWWYDNPCTELYARLAELAKRLDKTWLATVRRCTTPASPVNVEAIVPDVRGRAKTTVRLHPRRGKAAVDASKIGGMFLWPKKEPWPRCPLHDNLPYVTALQLRKEAVPELSFPLGKDLFQLLWCPEEHEIDYELSPMPQVIWRERGAVREFRKIAPTSTRQGGRSRITPRACVIHPERVTEYPDGSEFQHFEPEMDYENPLIDATLASLKPHGGPESSSHLYQYWISVAGGVKVGGYPGWIHRAEYPQCSCGAQMEHLLSFDSREDNGGRWQALEDRPKPNATGFAQQLAWDKPICNPLGCSFGDGGTVYVFVCRKCDGWPIRTTCQFS